MKICLHSCATLMALLFASANAIAAEIRSVMDDATGWEILELQQGSTVVRLAPAAGANAFSIRIDDVEYFRQPESLDRLPGAGYGNPILYPTPNRVRDAVFAFRDKTFRFRANAGKHFIHGLVNRQPWQVTERLVDDQTASVTCQISFTPQSPLHARFPLSHQLRVTVTVSERAVRWDYVVDNRQGTDAVPFGFALHPYFLYQGERKNTYLTIPATHWMESERMLPSGKLIPASELDYPLNEPMSLEGTKFDDVFFGMRPEKPARIEFRDRGESIEIVASPEFTHLVVWTPPRPYFGIESQTCSTDAHNLDNQGHKEAAHLQVCEPGHSLSGWVEYRFRR